MFIYNDFEKILRQVVLRRENLKQQIDNYSDEMIKSIERTQTDLIKKRELIEKQPILTKRERS